LDLGITLLLESELETFASGLDSSVAPVDSCAASIDAWEQFLEVKGRYPGLAEYFEFSTSTYWMAKGPGEQCRKLVAKLRRIRTELDPSKGEHLAVFGDALCLFLHAVSEMAIDLFLLLMRPTSREEYTDALMAVLYGGYDNLEAAQKIRRIALGADEEDSVSIFPDLGKFEHLIREIVQAPLQALPAALLARELAFRNLLGAPETQTSGEITAEHPYASKFIYLASTYLTKALRLPPELADIYNSQVGDLEVRVRHVGGITRSAP
jgi:hypothetical protein